MTAPQSILPTVRPHACRSCANIPAIAAFLPLDPMMLNHGKELSGAIWQLLSQSICWKNARDQAIGATQRQAKQGCRMLEIEPEARGGVRGVGAIQTPARYLDLPFLHSAALFQNLGGPASKNLGRPVLKMLGPAQNDAPRLSRGSASRRASCPLVAILQRARTHQRPSGGAL
jgi:hypothetical protein